MVSAIHSMSLHRPDLSPLLTKISAPTLICAAASDPYWNPADAARAASRLRNGAAVILPGSGHLTPLSEAAPAVTDLLTAFWADPDTVVARYRIDATASTPETPAT
jgi:pimeloyl-ACP methyl ester carboxylesterase